VRALPIPSNRVSRSIAHRAAPVTALRAGDVRAFTVHGVAVGALPDVIEEST
jgi:hypothetical protein